MASLQIRILSHSGIVFQGEGITLHAPGSEGEMTILPNHAPLLTQLDSGTISISFANQTVATFAIGGGFLEVVHNKVTILAEDRYNAHHDTSVP